MSGHSEGLEAALAVPRQIDHERPVVSDERLAAATIAFVGLASGPGLGRLIAGIHLYPGARGAFGQSLVECQRQILGLRRASSDPSPLDRAGLRAGQTAAFWPLSAKRLCVVSLSAYP